MLSKYIDIRENFKYSVNINYDFKNKSKINNFIPTSESLNILKKLLSPIINDNYSSNANMLIGSYGKGKSHLILLLITLLYEDKFEEYKELENKIIKIDSEYKNILKKLEEKKLLPIIVNSNYENLKETILYSLNESLKKEELTKLMPNTYFEEAINVLRTWNNNNIIEKHFNGNSNKYNINDMIKNLEFKNERVYREFKKIYKEVTYGIEFNPLVNSDINKIIEDTSYNLINSTKYDGFYFVFDEFSKFIESGLNKKSMNELNIIQNIAEFCNEGNSFLTCITHKTISDYTYQAKEISVDGWKAIDGRFNHIYYHTGEISSYELISNAIIQKNNLKSKFENEFKLSKRIFEETLIFDNLLKDKEELIIEHCFPLNPITTYSLILLNEKVAQNERTLFTYLSSNENGSLKDYIRNNKDTLVTLDSLFDYFKKSMEEEYFDKRIHDIYIKTQALLEEKNSKYEAKVIKTIAVLLIINNYEFLKPTKDTVKRSLNYNSEVEKIITRLENKSKIIVKESNRTINFLPGSGINIKDKIKEAINSNRFRYNKIETLEEILNLDYFIPKKYNIENNITRFLKKIIIELKDIKTIDFNQLLIDSKSDGLLIYVNSEMSIKNTIKELNVINIFQEADKRISFILSDKNFKIDKEVNEILAIQKLLANNEFTKRDPYIKKELEIFLFDRLEKLKNEFNKVFERNVCLFNNGEEIDISRGLNVTISAIFDEVFYMSPNINNELINKDKITSQILRSRNEILESIFKNGEIEFKIDGSSQTATIFRTLLRNKGYSKESNQIEAEKDENLIQILNEIEKFILNSEKSNKSFSELYKKLRNKPYGMRKGVIPVYLSLIINKYYKEIVLYFNNKEIDIDLDRINKINENPELYEVRVSKGTNETNNYLNLIDELFTEFDFNKKGNINKNRYSNIAQRMQSFIRNLPKISKESNYIIDKGSIKRIPNDAIDLRRELLKYEINPFDFLMKYIPKEIYKQENLIEIPDKICKFKKMLTNHVNNFYDYLKIYIKKTIDSNYKGEIGPLLITWSNSLDKSKYEYINKKTLNKFLKYCQNINNFEERNIVGQIGYIFTGLSIEDWNDETFKNFKEDLKESIDYINNLNIEKFDKKKTYKVIFDDEELDNKIIENIELNNISENLYIEIMDLLNDHKDQIDDIYIQNLIMKLFKKFTT